MNRDNLRCQRNLGVLLSLLACWSISAPALASSDPVEDLRQALPIDDVSNPTEAMLRFRETNLTRHIAALKTIGQLRRALALDEWRDDTLRASSPKIQEIDTRIRTKVGAALTAALQQQAKSPDADNRRAVANLIAEIGTSVRSLNPTDKSGYARSLTGLVQALCKDVDPAVRLEALRALSNINAPVDATAKLFAEVLRVDGEPGPRRLAAHGLGQMVRVANELQRRNTTTSNVRAERRDLVEAIEAAVRTSHLGFSVADAKTRQLAVESLQFAVQCLADLIPDGEARKDFPPVGRPLTDVEKAIVAKKSQALREEIDELRVAFIALRDEIATLTPLLSDADSLTRDAAAQALMFVGAARSRLRQRVLSLPNYGGDEKNNLVILAGADPLDGFLKKDLEAVAPLLRDSDGRLRKAATIFALLLEEQALPLVSDLIARLGDPERTIRWAAAKSLSKMPADKITRAVPALAKLLGDSDLGLRIVAAQTLEGMGPLAREAAHALAQAVAQGDFEGRQAAMLALLALGAQDAAKAVPQLVHVLGQRDADGKVLEDVCAALAAIGAAARPAIPALRLLLNHEQSSVRAAASEALLSISSVEQN